MMPKPTADVIEDLEFLDDTGVGAVNAAERTGFPNAHALEKWLERHDRHDLWLSLKRRDPEGTHLSGTDRKRARLMAAPAPTTIDTIAAVLADAAKSSRARTRNRAAKVQQMVDELRETLSVERDADRERETARKEIERLERQLAEAKARLRGGSTSVDVSDGISAAELRAWAMKNGIECPERGRVPSAVREAYEATEDDVAVTA